MGRCGNSLWKFFSHRFGFVSKSLAEKENGGSGGSGDLRLEKVRSKRVNKWTREVYCVYL